MRYISPIRFYKYCGIEVSQNITSIPLVRLKKLVSSEFAMTDGILSIDGYNYNKHDVLSEIEQPDWEQRLQYHILVWNTKGLLTYLEEYKIKLYEAKVEWLYLAKDEEFVKFISPYFAEAYSVVMKFFLNPPVFRFAHDWLVYLDFVKEDDREQALASLRVFLDDSIRLFKNINKDTYQRRIKAITPWGWGENSNLLINKLPASLFHYKDNLVRSMINLTVELQSVNIELTFRLSGCLSHFDDLEPRIAALIKKNHDVYKRAVLRHRKEEERGNPTNTGLVIIFILVIISIIKLILDYLR